MKTIFNYRIAFMLLLSSFGVYNTNAQTFERMIHGRGVSADWTSEVIATSDGGYAVCGFADSVIVFDTTTIPLVYSIVAKLNDSGVVLWKKKLVDWEFEVPVQLCAKSIAQTSDGGFVVTGWRRRNPNSGNRGPLFVFKLDALGNVVWRKYYATYITMGVDPQSSMCSGADIIIKPNDNHIVIAGVANEMIWDGQSYTYKNSDYGFCNNEPAGNNQKVWFLELDQLGNDVRSRVFAPTVNSGYKLAYTFRQVSFSYDPRGLQQEEHIVSIARCDDDGNGEFQPDEGYVLRVNMTSGAGNSGFSLLKLDVNANPQWWNLYSFRNNGNNQLASVGQEITSLLCDNGNMLVIGSISYTNLMGPDKCYKKKGIIGSNILLTKLRNDGTVIWAQDYGDPNGISSGGGENGYSVSYDNDCNAYLFGGKYATSPNEPGYANMEHQAWVIKAPVNLPLTPVLSAMSIGGNKDDHFVSGVYSTQTGYVFAGGHSTSYHFTPPVDNDLFLAGMDGNLVTGPCDYIAVEPCILPVTANTEEVPYISCDTLVEESYRYQNILEIDDWSCGVIPNPKPAKSDHANLSNNSFKVSPNPTNSIIRILYSGTNSNTAEVVVTDIAGKHMMMDKVVFEAGSTKEINLSQLAPGVYMVNITNAQGKTEVYKVVKE